MNTGTASNEGNSFLSGRNVKVMALCELIQGNQFIKKNNDIWVVPDDRTMVTRFLSVFVPGSTNFQTVFTQASSCRTWGNGAKEFEKEIRDCIERTWGGGGE